MTEKLLGPVA